MAFVYTQVENQNLHFYYWKSSLPSLPSLPYNANSHVELIHPWIAANKPIVDTLKAGSGSDFDAASQVPNPQKQSTSVHHATEKHIRVKQYFLYEIRARTIVKLHS